MKASLRGPRVFLLLAVCASLLSACGKKGPPLPPLGRVPAPPANPQAARFGADVYLWFTVPASNVSGQAPADVSAIDLYAVTATEPPAPASLAHAATRIASYPVYLAPPPPPPLPEGAPAPPPLPAPRGFAQGSTAVVRESLTPELRMPTVLPGTVAASAAPTIDAEAAVPSGPLVAPFNGPAVRRYYLLVAVGSRGRDNAPTAILSVPVADPSDAPTGAAVEYTEAGMTLSWQAPADAQPAPEPPDPELLPSKPLVAPRGPTGYHVFELSRQDAAPEDPFGLTLPTALNPQPLSVTTFAIPGPVRYGEERCFVVRSVDLVAGDATIGEASAPACVTPTDTFPPAAPTRLEAIAGVGVISLIWEPNTEPDLGGYIVLRGTAPGDTLQALTPAPIRETTYRDQSATPGVRYVYAVVAVDTASPQNVSAQSNRVEESSRIP